MNFFRSLSRKFTQTSVCASFSRLRDLGKSKKESILIVLNNYRKHEPFNELTDENIQTISETLSKFGEANSYLEAGSILGGLISDCGWEKSINKLKDKNLFAYIFMSDVCSKIKEIIKNNGNVAREQSLNLKEICINIIKSRKNWIFVREDELALLCKYNGEEVLIDFSNQDNNILDVFKKIIYYEILFENDGVLDKIDNFDSFFLACLNTVKDGDKK